MHAYHTAAVDQFSSKNFLNEIDLLKYLNLHVKKYAIQNSKMNKIFEFSRQKLGLQVLLKVPSMTTLWFSWFSFSLDQV